MKKQSYLTNFPMHVFATAKRRMQAAIRESRALLRARSFSGYAVLFEEFLPACFLESIDPTQRQRHFGQVPVFWAWLGQILEGNASCQRGLGLIQSWCLSLKLPVPSSDTSSYCKARGRVRLSFLKAIHHQVLGVLRRRTSSRDLWRGFRLKAIDGSSVQLLDTPANQKVYPQPKGQKAGCGFPVMGLVGLVDLAHGGWEHLKTCRATRHDSRAAAALLPHLQGGDLLLADRAFCTYEIIARSIGRGAHILMRLHQARHKALKLEQHKRIGQHEWLLTWKRPPYREGSALSRAQWQGLPETLTLRLIKLGYENRAGDKDELIVVTTLTDPLAYDGYELATLYARRWDIELKLRDLKTTLGLEMLKVKSPRMAHKTLWMSLIAYNLVRGLMQEAAAGAGRPIWHLSFKGVLDLVCSSHESFRAYVGKPNLAARARGELLDIIATKLINIRPFRQEPRAVKRRPKGYQLLTKPRHQFHETPHRENDRKTA